MSTLTRFRRALLAITCLAFPGACTVGPDFTAPDAKLPAEWHQPTEAAAVPHPDKTGPGSEILSATPDPEWWKSFNDPILTGLVERAIQDNLTVQQAVLRIAEARAGEMSAAAAGLPHLSGQGTYTREQLGLRGLAAERSGSLGSGSGSTGSSSNSQELSSALNTLFQPVDLFQAALDASWEIDLFGKVRRSVEAASAQTDAAIASRDDALVSVEAEIVQTYARVRGAEASRNTAKEDIAAESDLLDLTQQRAKFGLTSDLDVENATAQLRTSEASLPQYDSQIESGKDALCLLLGTEPGSLDQMLDAHAAIPPIPPDVPVGLPAALARRRPDIREAEATLHQQTADVGVAVASLFPDISLSANLGQRAIKAVDLTRWANNFYSFGPSVSLPIFQGGSLIANIRVAKAEQAEAALAYRQTVLTALSEINDAMVAYRTEQTRRASLDAAVAADRNAVAFARDRYVHGLSTFLDVLTSENNLDQGRQSLITSTVAESTDLVQLYKALGGGWEAVPTPKDDGQQHDQ